MTRDLVALFQTRHKAVARPLARAIWRMPGAALPLAMRLALYQPDIPQNTGTILRLAACLGVPVDVIGPTGFDMTDKALKRAGLDYLAHVDLERHQSFAAFETVRGARGSRSCRHKRWDRRCVKAIPRKCHGRLTWRRNCAFCLLQISDP